jgi:serine/threonine protein kinase
LENHKFCSRSIAKNKDFVLQEIIINYNVRHPNIIKLYGYHEHKNYMILIAEYMNNKDLKNFIKTKSDKLKFSEMLVGFFILQILKALDYLKMWNILHRDIKPENIMLDSSYNVKIGDFSIARKIDPLNNLNCSRCGTLPYMAPECIKMINNIEGSEFEKIDLFSVGVIMYIMLYNKHPYDYKVFYL